MVIISIITPTPRRHRLTEDKAITKEIEIHASSTWGEKTKPLLPLSKEEGLQYYRLFSRGRGGWAFLVVIQIHQTKVVTETRAWPLMRGSMRGLMTLMLCVHTSVCDGRCLAHVSKHQCSSHSIDSCCCGFFSFSFRISDFLSRAKKYKQKFEQVVFSDF